MKIRNLMTFCIMFIFLSGLIFASDPVESLFKKGNSHYEKGEYKKAIEKYEMITGREFKNPKVYYNLGNSYFKSGEPGEAILNYERAKRLDFSDEDIAFNLDFARGKTVDKVPERGFFEAAAEFCLGISSLELDKKLLLIIVWLIFIPVPCYLFVEEYWIKRILTSALIGLIFTALIMGGILGVEYYHLNMIERGIVTADVSEAFSGPSRDNTLLFKLHEGSKVKILKKQSRWYMVEAGEKKIGWVFKKEIETIHI